MMTFWNASGILGATFNRRFIGLDFSMDMNRTNTGACLAGFLAANVCRTGFINPQVLRYTLR
jgi:hypothetical protein